jgi:phage shock protein A
MALINRVTRLFRADFHAVLDQIEEPELLLKQAVREMEDDLAETEQRIRAGAHEQEVLADRKTEIDGKLVEIDEELDLCFASKKHDLARNLTRKKLEAKRLSQRLATKLAAVEKRLTGQQKAELFAQNTAPRGESEFDDISWMARELNVSDDEVEVAFLREKSARSPS